MVCWKCSLLCWLQKSLCYQQPSSSIAYSETVLYIAYTKSQNTALNSAEGLDKMFWNLKKRCFLVKLGFVRKIPAKTSHFMLSDLWVASCNISSIAVNIITMKVKDYPGIPHTHLFSNPFANELTTFANRCVILNSFLLVFHLTKPRTSYLNETC